MNKGILWLCQPSTGCKWCQVGVHSNLMFLTLLLSRGLTLNEEQKKILADIAEMFDQAEKCTDAGEKFLTLRSTAADLNARIPSVPGRYLAR